MSTWHTIQPDEDVWDVLLDPTTLITTQDRLKIRPGPEQVKRPRRARTAAEKAVELAPLCRPEPAFWVPSSSDPEGGYYVLPGPGICDCEGRREWGKTCCHVLAARIAAEQPAF